MSDLRRISEVKGVKRVMHVHDESKGTTDLRLHIDDDSVISDIISSIDNQGLKINRLNKKEPTLEDVFIKLVGRGLE